MEQNGKLGQNGIRPNMILEIFKFLALKVRAFLWGEREKKRRRKCRFGIHVWNNCLEYFFLYGKYEIYVWIL